MRQEAENIIILKSKTKSSRVAVSIPGDGVDHRAQDCPKKMKSQGKNRINRGKAEVRKRILP